MLEPVVLVATVRFPVVDGVVQLTEYATVAVPPEGTVAVRELPPLTVQFPATFVSATLWLPAARLLNVTLLFVPIVWLWLPSTVTEIGRASRRASVPAVRVSFPVLDSAQHV